MRLLFLLLCTIFSLSENFAQITVTNATFPQTGDTLKTLVASAPSGIVVTAPGPNQNWDFRSLSAQNSNNVIYRNPSEGNYVASFADATAMIKFGNVGETYLKSTATQFQNLGAAGNDPTGLGLIRANRFDQPYVLRRAPLSYANQQPFTTSAGFTFRFSADDLPAFIADSLLNNLPFRIDSMGVGIKQTRTDRVDAWGKIAIPGDTYEVIREQRTEINGAKIEAKLPVFGWRDITDLVGAAGGFGRFGSDTTVTYHFYSNVAKEPIAILTVGNDGRTVQSVEYKNNDTFTGLQPVNNGKPAFSAYPNPAIDVVRFDFLNLDAGIYTLKIYNILGKVVWEEKYRIAGNRSVQEDISKFRKGAYLYSLTNEKGRVIATKRLMVIRP